MKSITIAALVLPTCNMLAAPDPLWQNLSSKRREIPEPPGGSTMQTGAVVGDFDSDRVNDFILSFRQKAPALVWYRRTASGWDQYMMEKEDVGVKHFIIEDESPSVTSQIPQSLRYLESLAW